MERCVWKQKIMYTKEIVFKKEDIPNEETWNFAYSRYAMTDRCSKALKTLNLKEKRKIALYKNYRKLSQNGVIY